MRKRRLTTYVALLVAGYSLNAQVAPAWTNFVESKANGKQPILSDYSYSGYEFSEQPIPDISAYTYFNVQDYGATANDANYDDAGIQAAIDAAEASGKPAVVFFPAGRYTVSSDNDITKSISINSDHIVLKGEGSEENGTEIFMDKLRVSNGHWQFRFQPESYNTSTLTTLVEEAKRGDFTITVASAGNLYVGQSIFIYHKSEEFARAHYGNLALNETEWTRLFGTDGGLTFYECHIIDSINGNEVTFRNPIQVDLPVLTESFTIRNLKTIEGVGIEDIRFSSGWGTYPREFVHHADDTVDYGWNAVQFKYTQNAWIRNCEFKDWTQVADIRESIGVTVDSVLISGKQGHASWITRRNYGVLVKDCIDDANHHHGPGVGYSGVSTVYLRYKMSENQSIDCHSGSPFTTLMDDMDGGDFHTNGGPWESYPHHARYMTFWNFIHKKSSDISYNFWSVAARKPATYAQPYFIGLQPTNTVTMTGHGLDQMRGIAVEPKSLFEAQLNLRLNPTDTTTNSIYNKELSTYIQVFPNPTNEFITIPGMWESITLINTSGKELTLQVDNDQKIYVGNLPAGIYHIRLLDDSKVMYSRFVKE